ncbi:MAG: hypothetical protein ACLU9S_02120 [Oscillospiraceae bacterium]
METYCPDAWFLNYTNPHGPCCARPCRPVPK